MPSDDTSGAKPRKVPVKVRYDLSEIQPKLDLLRMGVIQLEKDHKNRAEMLGSLSKIELELQRLTEMARNEELLSAPVPDQHILLKSVPLQIGNSTDYAGTDGSYSVNVGVQGFLAFEPSGSPLVVTHPFMDVLNKSGVLQRIDKLFKHILLVSAIGVLCFEVGLVGILRLPDTTLGFVLFTGGSLLAYEALYIAQKIYRKLQLRA